MRILILFQIARYSCEGKWNGNTLCVLLNLISLLKSISNIAPLKKRSSLGSFTFGSNFVDVVSEAAVQSRQEYLDLSMYYDYFSIQSVSFILCLELTTDSQKASLYGMFLLYNLIADEVILLSSQVSTKVRFSERKIKNSSTISGSSLVLW